MDNKAKIYLTTAVVILAGILLIIGAFIAVPYYL